MRGIIENIWFEVVLRAMCDYRTSVRRCSDPLVTDYWAEARKNSMIRIVEITQDALVGRADKLKDLVFPSPGVPVVGRLVAAEHIEKCAIVRRVVLPTYSCDIDELLHPLVAQNVLDQLRDSVIQIVRELEGWGLMYAEYKQLPPHGVTVVSTRPVLGVDVVGCRLSISLYALAGAVRTADLIEAPQPSKKE